MRMPTFRLKALLVAVAAVALALGLLRHLGRYLDYKRLEHLEFESRYGAEYSAEQALDLQRQGRTAEAKAEAAGAELDRKRNKAILEEMRARGFIK